MPNRFFGAAALLLGSAATQGAPLELRGGDVEDAINGVLTLMSYSMTLDLASSSLSISDRDTGNPAL